MGAESKAKRTTSSNHLEEAAKELPSPGATPNAHQALSCSQLLTEAAKDLSSALKHLEDVRNRVKKDAADQKKKGEPSRRDRVWRWVKRLGRAKKRADPNPAENLEVVATEIDLLAEELRDLQPRVAILDASTQLPPKS